MMTRLDGLVTTIVPVYNRTDMLAEAVDSVVDQSYRPIEIIIVDDGSTDDTPAACDALAAAHPDIIRVIHQPNGGPGLAREAALGAARGEFIQFLDSDDLLLPGKLEAQVAALQQQPECGVAYGWTASDASSTFRSELPRASSAPNISRYSDGRSIAKATYCSATARIACFPLFAAEAERTIRACRS